MFQFNNRPKIFNANKKSSNIQVTKFFIKFINGFFPNEIFKNNSKCAK